MLIDTHCHLNFDEFENDREEIIGRCLANDVWMINVGADLETSEKAIEIAEKYEKGVYASIALHPHNVGPATTSERVRDLAELAKSHKVVAIGECGLDYAFCENDEKIQELQQEVFIQHLELAKEVNKPVVFHCRRLYPEMLKLISNFNTANFQLTGVLHCYMGRWSYAEEYLKLGFYIGFTGLITYARDYDKVIKNCPLDRILIETDAPYLPPHQIFGGGGLTPEERRKIRNTPDNVKYVAEKIAEIKEISFEEVASQTTQNAKELFRI
ncbi:MAG: TatD family hydrolase [Patescibacteria group bacterium]